MKLHCCSVKHVWYRQWFYSVLCCPSRLVGRTCKALVSPSSHRETQVLTTYTYSCKVAVLLSRSIGSLCHFNFILEKTTNQPTTTLESCSAYLEATAYVWLNAKFWEFHCLYWLKTIDGNAHQNCMASSCCSTREQVFCRSYIKFIVPMDILNILEHLRCQ